MPPALFPVMASERHKSIPWPLIAPHAPQALINHSQTLERLAERGGLSPFEACLVLTDTRFSYQAHRCDSSHWAMILSQLVAAYESTASK